MINRTQDKVPGIPLTAEQQAQHARLAQPRDMPVMPRGTSPAVSADDNPSDGFYSRLLAHINPPETAEEQARRVRREKREKTLARLSDGLSLFSSLANLYYTTRGAPNMYSPPLQSETELVKNRWDKLHELYRQRTREYADATAKAHALDEALAERRRAARRQAERDKAADDYRAGVLRLKAAANAADAARKDKTDAFNRERFAESKRHNRAMEIRKTSTGRGRRYYGTFNGRPYATKADYDKAVRAAAAAEGIQTGETRDVITGRDGKPIQGTGRTVNRSTAAIAADTERKRQQEEAARHAPTAGKKQKKPDLSKLKDFIL